MCLDLCIQTMSNVVRVVADVFVDVHVRGFCRILLRHNRTTQRVPAYVASACKPQKPIVKEKSDWDIGENATRTVLTSAGHGTYVVSAAVAVDVDVVTSVVETE